MATQVAEPVDRLVPVRGLNLHVRQWPGERRPWLLVHGLASNCLTWEATARHLHAAGHPVVTVDQRGHGHSDKPDTGYSFDDVTADLRELIDALGFQEPLIAGQSWGGNVVLAFGARYPGAAAGITFVDGGFINLSNIPGATWDTISVQLKPPALAGTPRAQMQQRMRNAHPDWSDEGIEHQLGNFEALADGTIRPWLTLDRHMQILRSLWEQRPGDLYPAVQEPVLIAPADGGGGDWAARKHHEVEAAQAALPNARVHWFTNTDHDIHVQRPRELADLLLGAVQEGFFPG